MKRQFRLTLGILILGIIAIPVSFFITILLAPVWNWFESISGIESIGHSGPSDWCFMLVYIVLLVGILIIFAYRILKIKDKVSPEK